MCLRTTSYYNMRTPLDIYMVKKLCTPQTIIYNQQQM